MVTSKGWGMEQYNNNPVIQPVESIRWYFKEYDVRSVESGTLYLMWGSHKLYLGKSTHSIYQIHMELLCNLKV
jgi:hypothetical protein